MESKQNLWPKNPNLTMEQRQTHVGLAVPRSSAKAESWGGSHPGRDSILGLTEGWGLRGKEGPKGRGGSGQLAR